MNRTLFILALLLIIYSDASAQSKYAWSLDVGGNLPLFDNETVNGIEMHSVGHSSPAASFKLLKVNHRVNYGLTLFYDTYNFTFVGNGELGYNINCNHKSSFISIAPVADVALDNTNAIHVLLMPTVGFFAGGNETGKQESYLYYSPYLSEQPFNTSEYITKVMISLKVSVQARINLSTKNFITAELGYSFFETPLTNVLNEYPIKPGLLNLKLGYLHAWGKNAAKKKQ